MTNLIEKIREMQEVGDFVATTAEMDTLLAALGKVQAGDSEILDLFVAFMSRFKPDGHLNDIGPGAKITNAKAAACLRRYASMARLLEGKE